MVKKQTSLRAKPAIVTCKQSLRKASSKLQRHILSKNSSDVKQILDRSLNNYHISFTTYNYYKQLMNRSEATSIQADEKRSKIKRVRKSDQCANEFEQLLSKSQKSYEKTYQIFCGISLKEKFKHLIKSKQEEEERKTDHSDTFIDLIDEEVDALEKMKALYQRYQVSNMFKENVLAKIKKIYIQGLIQKGYIRETKKGILSLCC